MKKIIGFVSALVALFAVAPLVLSMAVSISNGIVTDFGAKEVLTDFGMITGGLQFKLGSFIWPVKEVWLLPVEMDPGIFSKGVSQQNVLEIPQNVTWSTCRTAVYLNSTVGYGFKIYNTASTTQILPNGTFCGLSYNGTYFVYGDY